MIFYQVNIFEQSGFALDPQICAIITSVVLVVCTLVASGLVAKFNRKTLLLLSALGMALCLFVLGAYFSVLQGLKNTTNEGDAKSMSNSFGYIALLALMVYLTVFSFGFGPIVWMMVCGLRHMHETNGSLV